MSKHTFFSSALVVIGAVVFSTLLIIHTIFAASNLTSSVTVGASAPTVSGTTLNGGATITLNPNTTTSISVFSTITDNNGCAEINGGTTSILVYRNGVTSSTCAGSPNNLNCYIASAFTATSTCTGTSTTENTTTTFGIYYFAQATDASSSFPTDSWRATVKFTSADGTTSTQDSATDTLATLTALNITTSSINYGTLAASSTSGSTNQTTTITNAGNSSSTLNLSGTALVSGSNSIATSSQHYATSSFTYGGAEQLLSGSAVSVSGFKLTSPTSTNSVSGTIFWGLGVPAGSATGTYTGTSTYAAVFST